MTDFLALILNYCLLLEFINFHWSNSLIFKLYFLFLELKNSEKYNEQNIGFNLFFQLVSHLR